MWLLIIVLILVVALVIYLISAYNGLIRRRNQIENAWSQIDVQLKRRLDLIPNLGETVKGYAAHEKETLDAVITARIGNSPLGIRRSMAPKIFSKSRCCPGLAGNRNSRSVSDTGICSPSSCKIRASEALLQYQIPGTANCVNCR